MGRSRADKARTHDRIVKLAAARVREAGVDGVGVADLMNDAGLTHGGFYRHFESRDDLVAEACEAAFAHSGTRMTKAAGPAAEPSLGRLIDDYLSVAHRDDVSNGCALVALAGDAGRTGARVREAYAKQVEFSLALIGRLVDGPDPKAARSKAMVTLSALVGALALSRAVDGRLSEEILALARDALRSLVDDAEGSLPRGPDAP